MSLSGIGNYYTIKNNKVVNKCVSSFELTKKVNTNVSQYEVLEGRYNVATEAAITGVSYILKLNLENVDYEDYVSHFGLLDQILTSEIDFSGEDHYEYKYVGYGVLPSGQRFGVVIPQMFRNSGSSIKPSDSVSAEYIAIEPKIYNLTEVETPLNYSLLLAEPPDEYSSGSKVKIFGKLVPIGDAEVDFTQIPVTINFGFATETTKTVTPSADGSFNLEFEVAQLSFPAQSVITLETTEKLYEKVVTVRDPNNGVNFTFNLSGGEDAGSEFFLTGTAPAGANILINTNGLNGELDGAQVVTRLNNSWNTKGVVPEGAQPGDTYSVTASTDGFDTITINKTISSDLTTFTPILAYE